MSDMFVGRLKKEVPKSIELITNAIIDKEIAELNISDNALGPIGVVRGPHKILTYSRTIIISLIRLGIYRADMKY